MGSLCQCHDGEGLQLVVERSTMEKIGNPLRAVAVVFNALPELASVSNREKWHRAVCWIDEGVMVAVTSRFPAALQSLFTLASAQRYLSGDTYH